MNFENSKLFNALATGGAQANIGNRHRWWVLNPTAAAIAPTITFQGAPASAGDSCVAGTFAPMMVKDSCDTSTAPAAATYTFAVSDPIPAGQARAVQFHPHGGMPAFVKAAATAGALVWLEVSGLV